MKLKLLGKYEAEVSELFAHSASLSERDSKDTIAVWLTFAEPVFSCLSFAVDIPAKDYSEDEFIEYVRSCAEIALTNIIKKGIEARRVSQKRDESRKSLNKLTADLGDKLGIQYRLDLK